MAINDSKTKKLNWEQIVISAFATALLSLIVSIIVFNYTKEKPRLLYDVFPVSKFISDKTELGIYNIQIFNDGSKEAENITCDFSFPKNIKVIDIKVEPSSAAISYIPVKDSCNYKKAFSFPLLNPNENCKFSFLVENIENDELLVSLRAKGVVGEERSSIKTTEASNISTLITIMMLLMGLLVVMIMALFRIRDKRNKDNLDNKDFTNKFYTAVDYCDMGLYSESILLLKKCIYEYPESSYIHSNLARALANLKEFDNSFNELKIAFRLIEDIHDRRIYFYCSAQVNALLGNTDESIELLKKAIEIEKDSCIEKAKADDEFNSIRDNEEFAKLISG